MVKNTLIIVLILSIGCKRPHSNLHDQNVDKPEIVESNPNVTQNKFIPDDRLNLDSLLLDKYNNYLLGLRNGHLGICCYDNVLDSPFPYLSESTLLSEYNFLELNKEYYKFDGKIEEVKVYKYGDSYFKTHILEYEGEYYTNIVCGRILSDKFLFRNGIHIGMKKNDFLNLIFRPSELFNKIDTVSISRDEMGDAETNYIFNKEKLIEITFDSSYDWIDRGINK